MRRCIVALALVAAPFLASVSQAQSGQEPKGEQSQCDKLGPSDKASPTAKAQMDKGKHLGWEKKCPSDVPSGGGDDTQSPPPAPAPAPSGAQVRGVVYIDLNFNGSFDSGEPTISDWPVLVNGAASQSVRSDGNGNFAAVGLAVGSYTVCAGSQAGFQQVAPFIGVFCSGGGFGYNINVGSDAPDVAYTNVNFGFRMP